MAEETQNLRTYYEIDLDTGDGIERLARLGGAIDELQRKLKELEATEGRGTRTFAEGSVALSEMEGLYRRLQNEVKGLDASQVKVIRSTAEQARAINANEAAAQRYLKTARQQVTVQQEIANATQKSTQAQQQGAQYTKTYANGFTPLAFEVQQIARELPNISQGLPLFFRSLSNNLPMLQDRLRGARKELADLNAQGIKGIPIWKQVITTVFSWQTALIAGITILTAFSDEIAGFVSGLFDANAAAKRFQETTRQAISDAQDEIVTLHLLSEAARDTARSTEERTVAAVQLQETYPDTFGNLTVEEIMLGNVAAAYGETTEAILRNAQAEAYRSKIVENNVKILEIQAKAFNFGNTLLEGLTGGLYTAAERAGDRIAKLVEENNLYAESINTLGLADESYEELQERLAKEEESRRKKAEQDAKASERERDRTRRESYQADLKALDLSIEIEAAKLKATRMNLSSNINERVRFEAELFALQQRGYRQRLDLQLKYDQIAQNEYEQRLRLHEIASADFENAQAAQLAEFVADLHETVLKLAQVDTDELIAATIKKFDDAKSELSAAVGIAPIRLPEMTDEEFNARLIAWEELALKSAQIEIALERQKQAELKEIRDSALKAQLEQIDSAMSAEYGDDLAKFADNEREKLRITNEVLAERIVAYREAGAATWELEAQLNANRRKQAKLDLDLALNSTVKNATDRYNAQKAAIERELELTRGNVDEQAKLEKQLSQLTLAYQKDRADAAVEFLKSATELAKEVMGVFDALDARRVQDLEDNFNREKQLLADKYATGLLTEAQYNAQVLKLETKLDKERRKMERDAAKREKAIAIAEIITNTARAIMETLAQTGFFGIPLTVLVAALGAAQLATVVATPLPKAADGMLVAGPSHAQGGVVAELEGGEVVINKRSASAFMPELSTINVAGGGVPFVAGVTDGGFAARSAANNLTEDMRGEIARAVVAGIKESRIYVAVDDLHRAEQKYARAVNSGTIS